MPVPVLVPVDADDVDADVTWVSLLADPPPPPLQASATRGAATRGAKERRIIAPLSPMRAAARKTARQRRQAAP